MNRTPAADHGGFTGTRPVRFTIDQAGMHGGCHVNDGRSSFTERMQSIAAGLHEFVSLGDLAKRVSAVHGVPLPRARGEVLVFLRDRPNIPLYARRAAGWVLLQDRDTLKPSRRAGVINPGLHGWGPSGPPAPGPEFRGRTGFFGLVAAGRLPEQLLSSIGVRMRDVGQSLGLPDDDEPAPPGASGLDMAGRVLALKAEQARQQREWDDDIAEHIAHDALFMTVGEFGQEIVRRHHLPNSEAWLLAYDVLKAHPDLELFCRWEDSFRWSPLPPCPVAPASRLRDKNQRYYNGKFGHMGPTYMHPVRDGSIPSPDPLASALGQGNGTGWWPTDCLAIRRDLAERLLGTPAPPADDAEPAQPLTPAPAAVQSMPTPDRPDDATIFGEVDALEKARQRRTTAAVAEKYGVSVDTIQRACRNHKTASRPACSVFDQPKNGTPKTR